MSERDAYMIANAFADVWSGRKRRFHYATVPAEYLMLGARVDFGEGEAYVADDFQTRAVRKLLEKGYRWIRTDGEWAVFEKEIFKP